MSAPKPEELFQIESAPPVRHWLDPTNDPQSRVLTKMVRT